MIHQPLGKIDCFGTSRKHPRFQRNSDRFVVADIRPSLRIHCSTDSSDGHCANLWGESQGQLLVLADGVGERSSAARASTLAVDTVNTYLLNAVSVPPSKDDFEESGLFDEFKTAIDACRDAMHREVEAADRFDAMGAVMTVVLHFLAYRVCDACREQPRLSLAASVRRSSHKRPHDGSSATRSWSAEFHTGPAI